MITRSAGPEASWPAAWSWGELQVWFDAASASATPDVLPSLNPTAAITGKSTADAQSSSRFSSTSRQALTSVSLSSITSITHRISSLTTRDHRVLFSTVSNAAPPTICSPVLTAQDGCTYGGGRGLGQAWGVRGGAGGAGLKAGQEDYWIRQIAESRCQYLSGKGETPGRWYGARAAAAGLEAIALDEQCHAMFEGKTRSPASGSPAPGGSPTRAPSCPPVRWPSASKRWRAERGVPPYSGRCASSPNRNDSKTKRRPAVTSRTSCRCEQLNSSAAPGAGRYSSGPYSGKRS